MTAEDGVNYERRFITQWIKEAKRDSRPLVSPVVTQKAPGAKRGDPEVRVPMGENLVDNAELKAEIEQFIEKLSQSRASSGGPAQEPREVDSVQRLSRIFTHLDGLQDILHDLLSDWEPPQVIFLLQGI